MKKLVVFSVLFLLVLCTGFVVADLTETEKVNNAYACLEERMDGGCSSAWPDTRAFSLLDIGECESEIEADMINDLYWSNQQGQSIKFTAQSILALSNANKDVSDSEDWLFAQNKTPLTLDWFLEIDSPVDAGEQAICEVSWSGGTATVTIEHNRTLSVSGGGVCLTPSQSPYTNYYVKIGQTCITEEFTITCDYNFLTTLLFKKDNGNVLHVSVKSTSMSAGESTTERVKSLCFTDQSNTCDYEGSLWAAMVLRYLGNDVTYFMPYLIVFADEPVNEKYLPESFLYYLTNYQEFKSGLLLKQNPTEGYWPQFGDIFTKYYDTGVAGLGLQGGDGVAKAKQWLMKDGVQASDGCWGSTLDTAILLYSFWGDFSYGGGFGECDDHDDCDLGYICLNGTCVPDEGTGGLDCISMGYDCMSPISCSAEILDYECDGMLVCCSALEQVQTCAEFGGIFCVSGETCTGVTETASDGQCCVGGSCQEASDQGADCELNGGECRMYGCQEGEIESIDYECPYYGDYCCVEDVSDTGGGYWWIWLLLVLIVLVILGIIFRDKLRPIWIKVKSKFGGKGKAGPRPGPRGPPGFPPAGPPGRPGMQRRILPPSAQRRPMPRARPRPKGEVDDVLKKLKEMGK